MKSEVRTIMQVTKVQMYPSGLVNKAAVIVTNAQPNVTRQVTLSQSGLMGVSLSFTTSEPVAEFSPGSRYWVSVVPEGDVDDHPHSSTLIVKMATAALRDTFVSRDPAGVSETFVNDFVFNLHKQVAAY